MGRDRILIFLAAVAVVLNMLDAVFTLMWVELGWATEANPFMAFLLLAGPIAFMTGKLTLVSFGVNFLWKWRDKAIAGAGLLIACLVYATIVAKYHVPALMALRGFMGV